MYGSYETSPPPQEVRNKDFTLCITKYANIISILFNENNANSVRFIIPQSPTEAKNFISFTTAPQLMTSRLETPTGRACGSDVYSNAIVLVHSCNRSWDNCEDACDF